MRSVSTTGVVRRSSSPPLSTRDADVGAHVEQLVLPPLLELHAGLRRSQPQPPATRRRALQPQPLANGRRLQLRPCGAHHCRHCSCRSSIALCAGVTNADHDPARTGAAHTAGGDTDTRAKSDGSACSRCIDVCEPTMDLRSLRSRCCSWICGLTFSR